ncbi:MAG TPA: nuclear transport factor 2 family protein [Puia sp.]|nr:nuclear transport factor 2 family protein [Puia sp.]
MKKIIKQFIHATNAFDVEAALALFADDAVIDDVSVGEKFKNTSGVRKYLENFFVGYKTVTRLESIVVLDNRNAKAHVDFTGDFGHETGGLNFTFNSAGLIITINAYLD